MEGKKLRRKKRFAILKCIQKKVANKEIVLFDCSRSLALNFQLIAVIHEHFEVNIDAFRCRHGVRTWLVMICTFVFALFSIWASLRCSLKMYLTPDCVGLTAPDGGATYYLWCDSNIQRGLVYKTQAYCIVRHLQLPYFADIKVKEQTMENLMR